MTTLIAIYDWVQNNPWTSIIVAVIAAAFIADYFFEEKDPEV